MPDIVSWLVGSFLVLLGMKLGFLGTMGFVIPLGNGAALGREKSLKGFFVEGRDRRLGVVESVRVVLEDLVLRNDGVQKMVWKVGDIRDLRRQFFVSSLGGHPLC